MKYKTICILVNISCGERERERERVIERGFNQGE